mmetsp:Transcript_24179/g.81571  ORF Transcript_24179/g.81571 Transcript_24179/m.81571 type:complete len:333 (-) Transcript_24179:62-1060(-)
MHQWTRKLVFGRDVLDRQQVLRQAAVRVRARHGRFLPRVRYALDRHEVLCAEWFPVRRWLRGVLHAERPPLDRHLLLLGRAHAMRGRHGGLLHGLWHDVDRLAVLRAQRLDLRRGHHQWLQGEGRVLDRHDVLQRGAEAVHGRSGERLRSAVRQRRGLVEWLGVLRAESVDLHGRHHWRLQGQGQVLDWHVLLHGEAHAMRWWLVGFLPGPRLVVHGHQVLPSAAHDVRRWLAERLRRHEPIVDGHVLLRGRPPAVLPQRQQPVPGPAHLLHWLPVLRAGGLDVLAGRQLRAERSIPGRVDVLQPVTLRVFATQIRGSPKGLKLEGSMCCSQ